ncbi:hypothetical protein M9H77_16894 [Catharanthus roseus]|uniref:Uncharacterized protein n=1 Tax=Catharanthus roseus TaxID=4058 RepID=A0ACC0B341_CATRO|nr:hypothetical protein M9H77_16894 [Catharanthus roseus]
MKKNKSTTNKAIELWLKKLEDAAIEADYLLDEFAYKVLRKKIDERKLLDKDRITDSFVDNAEIIGRNYDVEKVVSALITLENKKDLSVIGIVEMAGQGKTMLTQLVYGREEVTRKYKD